jgi:hypothetical protein
LCWPSPLFVLEGGRSLPELVAITPAVGHAFDHGIRHRHNRGARHLLSRQLLQESLKAQTLLQRTAQTDDWRSAMAAHRWLGPLWTWADQQLAGAIAPAPLLWLILVDLGLVLVNRSFGSVLIRVHMGNYALW